tara:strand:- start:60359 stop:60880 length:522 start_codon:yes stop_codon:yes gene_type:complete
MQADTEKVKAKTIVASKLLQAKVGRGQIREDQALACKKALETSTSDFEPVALEFLNSLEHAIDNATNSSDSDLEAHKALLFKPIFDLKANAKMFKYDLVSIMANIMVTFLEKITHLDKDAVEIVKAHHQTLTLIVQKKMNGTGGEAGKALAKELQSACLRYFSKRKTSPQVAK